MRIQYFKSAWGDIKNSPGWFGKLCLLALVAFIPVFGPIVIFGYLYGWAREIAWGTHEPMPTRIFGNDDGKLYRRGWFIFVLVFVAALVPAIVMSIGSSMQGSGSHAFSGSALSVLGGLVNVVGFVGAVFLAILAWIGSMRISIYDRLSAGFQIGKIWKMFRHDTNGIMRIFGMNVLVGFITGIVASIVIWIIMIVVVLVGVAGLAAAGYSPSVLQYHSLQGMSGVRSIALALQILSGAGVVGLLGLLASAFLSLLASTFVQLLVTRAVGYWTMQFDVPRWRGQDEPMPFEAAQPLGGIAPVNPAASAAQAPYGAYGQPVVQPAQQQPAQQQPAQQQPAVQPAQQQSAQQQPAWHAPVAAPVANDSAANAPVAPVREAEPAQYWRSSLYGSDAEEPLPEDEEEQGFEPDELEADARVDKAEQGTALSQAAQQPTLEPGQLSGFTYTGASGVRTPITPSGADPSVAAAPDLLVVVPDVPSEPVEGDLQDDPLPIGGERLPIEDDSLPVGDDPLPIEDDSLPVGDDPLPIGGELQGAPKPAGDEMQDGSKPAEGGL